MDFDLPALNQSISMNAQQIEFSKKKIMDLKESTRLNEKEIEDYGNKLGIDPTKNVDIEISKKVRTLPEVAKELKSTLNGSCLHACIEYYKKFCEFVSPNSNSKVKTQKGIMVSNETLVGFYKGESVWNLGLVSFELKCD